MNFDNKIALVTGAAVGIGRATALTLLQNGASVILLDNNGEKLEVLKKELVSYGDKILSFVCDISDEESVYKVVKESLDTFGKIDILINNAALWRDKSNFIDTPIDVWKKYIDINIMGTIYITKAVLPSMIEQCYGRIINVASVAGVYGNKEMAHYSATKGAVISFTKALAKEVVGNGVLVNAVSPGSVSPSNENDIDYHRPTDLSYMGRTGTDRENADLICFLASDKSSYITGQNIQIDGCRLKI